VLEFASAGAARRLAVGDHAAHAAHLLLAQALGLAVLVQELRIHRPLGGRGVVVAVVAAHLHTTPPYPHTRWVRVRVRGRVWARARVRVRVGVVGVWMIEDE